MTSAKSPVPLNIIVVGSGLAGLSTALCLSSKGHDVTVLERSSQLQTGGADIQLASNAAKLLDKLGLMSSLKHVANPKEYLHWRGWKSMNLLARNPIDLSMTARYVLFPLCNDIGLWSDC